MLPAWRCAALQYDSRRFAGGAKDGLQGDIECVPCDSPGFDQEDFSAISDMGQVFPCDLVEQGAQSLFHELGKRLEKDPTGQEAAPDQTQECGVGVGAFIIASSQKGKAGTRVVEPLQRI